MRKSLFILPSLGASIGRNCTHIAKWKEVGAYTIVCAFTRGDTVANDAYVDVNLGEVPNGLIIKRLKTYRNALEKLTGLLRGMDVVFVYTLDTFVFAWMAKVRLKSNVKIVFFLMDIRERFIGDSVFSQIVQSFIRFSFERCELVVVTSDSFVHGYADKYLGALPCRWIEIENKVDSNRVERSHVGLSSKSNSNDEQTVTVGYFGALRCTRSLETLLAWVRQEAGRVKLLLRGVFVDIEQELIDEITSYHCIEYGGYYKNPEDLNKIYTSCDIVWACYPYSEKQIGNYLWAKTNRYYEAGYFRRPMITSKNTRDAENAIEHGIGLAVDLSSVESAVRTLSAVTPEFLDQCANSYDRLDPDNFIYSSEFRELHDLLFS